MTRMTTTTTTVPCQWHLRTPALAVTYSHSHTPSHVLHTLLAITIARLAVTLVRPPHLARRRMPSPSPPRSLSRSPFPTSRASVFIRHRTPLPSSSCPVVLHRPCLPSPLRTPHPPSSSHAVTLALRICKPWTKQHAAVAKSGSCLVMYNDESSENVPLLPCWWAYSESERMHSATPPEK